MTVSPSKFFEQLFWLDGRPLLETMEPYRLAIFDQVFLTLDTDGRRRYNMALTGRAKKNWKTADLVLAALYCLLMVESPTQGNDCFVIANDEDQAADDLELAKKFVAANPLLQAELRVLAKEIVRTDGRGSIGILPAHDVLGMHGKTYLFLGIDEMHGYRDYGVLEALAPDPSRDPIIWITTYASIYHSEGAPLHDYFLRGKAGDDPRMFFSWYSADFCTDTACVDLPPEQRANPSMGSWNNADYLEQQRRRLPAHKFRRLHLNLPGMPDGAYFDPGKVSDCITAGVRQRAPDGKRYYAFVDMSGGSLDDAVLAIAYHDGRRVVLAAVVAQSQKPTFDPRMAVEKFAGLLAKYDCHSVTGDSYGGNIFRADFARFGITYLVCPLSKHELYEEFEPLLNSCEIALLDEPRITEQLLGLVVRGMKIDHQTGEHDDYANVVAGVAWLACRRSTSSIDDTPDVTLSRCDYDPLEERRSVSAEQAAQERRLRLMPNSMRPTIYN